MFLFFNLSFHILEIEILRQLSWKPSSISIRINADRLLYALRPVWLDASSGRLDVNKNIHQ
jgi:hypothetical protein